jgi:prevent-host-death family protein
VDSVGIRELKAKLSEYLDRAASGETIVITHRGRAKAELGPITGRSAVARGITEGWIREGKPGSPPIPKRRYRGRMTIAEAMAEDDD